MKSFELQTAFNAYDGIVRVELASFTNGDLILSVQNDIDYVTARITVEEARAISNALNQIAAEAAYKDE